MLLSRFWVLLLAVAAILGLSTALLARGMFNRGEIVHADEGLRRDRFELESLMKLDARARIDALAPIAADGTVREAVRTKGKDKVDGQDGPKALKDRLRTMNQQLEELRADIMIAVDNQGVILAQEGKKPARAGAGLGKVPLVEQALGGFLGDDVWIYDGAVYRMAARPIVDRGQYVGALIHGQKLDGTLAQRLSERLGGATVGFFLRDQMVSSYVPADVPGAPTQAELAPLLANVLTDERLKKGERTEAFDLGGKGRAVFSLVAGSASAAQVGYAIARPYPTMPSPWAIFDQATKEDMNALPTAALVGALVLLFAIGMGIMYLERDRPLALFQREVDKLAAGQTEELDLAALSKAHRKIGEGVHKGILVLLEKGGGKSRQQKANLDQLLGPTPEALTSSAFSFGSDDGAARSTPQPMAMPAPMPMPAPKTPSHNNIAPVRAAMPQPSGPKLPPPPAPAPAPARPSNGGAPARGFTPMQTPAAASSQNDEATVMSDISEELREATREDEGHYREVFAQYVEVRRQCGETTAELAFEKFVVTLRKNRDQILASRPDTKDVRFSVYVKAGKAALKATPAKG
ncbi:MAG: MXAN_5187 family protein [Myxococcales bacterium]